ncbi:MAG TPA: Fe-S cluster assembly protein SufD, partial [Gemmatimonadales bacterium]|nr:Fe-S cluster assembly protein SufD [Gemmatimonadales bacterium]
AAFTRTRAPWTVEGGARSAGIRVMPLDRALAEDGDLVAAHLGRHARLDDNPFTALATAFASDVIVVAVADRAESAEPIRLTCRIPEHANAAMAFPRVLIVLGDHARATVIEQYAGASPHPYFSAPVTEIVLGTGARLDHIRVQQEGAAALHLAATHSHQERDSTLHSTSAVFGGALARQDVTAVLGGSGASLILNGLSVVRGVQHVDHHTTIEHAQPHCESHELFNGIFDGHSRGVFNGRIIVHPGAQRTDSKQTSNNLLLSADARADTQPQLEIYADDVKCTHGATLGPLDPSALFYLASRGIGPAEARGLLTYGFGADILARIPTPDVRETLDRVVRERLGIAVPAAA